MPPCNATCCARFSPASASTRTTSCATRRSRPSRSCATRYPFGLLQVPLEQTVRVHASSGTRGKPTIVAYTPRDLDVFAEV